MLQHLSLFLLLDVNFALRKIVCLLKPTKEITHDPATGTMKIRTLTTFKNFNMDFTIGKEFTEDLGPVDGRVCQVCVLVFPNVHICMFGHARRFNITLILLSHYLLYKFDLHAYYSNKVSTPAEFFFSFYSRYLLFKGGLKNCSDVH